MRKSSVTLFLLLASTIAASAANCPTEAETHASITDYINNSYWSPGQRDIWKIKSVGGFNFSPMKVGKIIKKQVEYGKAAENVCPIRITYSFDAIHQDGRKETTKMGEGKTHLFYKNGFDEWIFKTD